MATQEMRGGDRAVTSCVYEFEVRRKVFGFLL
jgi:hypothetical protein